MLERLVQLERNVAALELFRRGTWDGGSVRNDYSAMDPSLRFNRVDTNCHRYGLPCMYGQ